MITSAQFTKLSVAFGVALGLSVPAAAQTEIQWWHAMTGGNNDIVNKLAEEFNASQSDYKVVPSFKGSYPDTMNAGIAARVWSRTRINLSG